MTILYRVFHGYLITDWWLPQTFLWLQPLSELSLALAGYIIDCSAIIYVPHLESNIWLHDKLLLLFTLSCPLLLFIVVLRVRIPCFLFHCHYFLRPNLTPHCVKTYLLIHFFCHPTYPQIDFMMIFSILKYLFNYKANFEFFIMLLKPHILLSKCLFLLPFLFLF